MKYLIFLMIIFGLFSYFYNYYEKENLPSYTTDEFKNENQAVEKNESKNNVIQHNYLDFSNSYTKFMEEENKEYGKCISEIKKSTSVKKNYIVKNDCKINIEYSPKIIDNMKFSSAKSILKSLHKDRLEIVEAAEMFISCKNEVNCKSLFLYMKDEYNNYNDENEYLNNEMKKNDYDIEDLKSRVLKYIGKTDDANNYIKSVLSKNQVNYEFNPISIDDQAYPKDTFYQFSYIFKNGNMTLNANESDYFGNKSNSYFDSMEISNRFDDSTISSDSFEEQISMYSDIIGYLCNNGNKFGKFRNYMLSKGFGYKNAIRFGKCYVTYGKRKDIGNNGTDYGGFFIDIKLSSSKETLMHS